MATSSAPITTLLLSNKTTHNYKKFNDDGQCSYLLRHTNLHRFSSTPPSNRDLVVRRATPEVAGDLLSSFSLPTIPGFEDNPWLVGVCGLVVGLPLMIQKLVSLSKQLDAAAQTVENIADAVERVADEVDKAAEGLKEALPEGKLKEVAAYVEKLAENTSDGADKISDVMDMMLYQRFIIRHGGGWDRSEYVGGDEQLIYLSSDDISYTALLAEVYNIVQSDPLSTEYCLFYTSSICGGSRTVKGALKSNEDIHRMLFENRIDPVIYVVTKLKQPPFGYEASQSQRSVRASGPSISLADDFVDEDDATSTDDCRDDDDDADDVEEEMGEEEEDEDRRKLFDSLISDFSRWIQAPGRLDRSGLCDRNLSRAEHTDGGADDREVRQWVFPLIEIDAPARLEWVEPSEWGPAELCVGATFSSKDELEIAVGLYHLHHRLEYSTERSSTTRLNFICKHGNECPFMLRARQAGGVWRVFKVDLMHSCQIDIDRVAPRRVPARVLGKYFSRKLATEGAVLKPKEMMSELESEFGIQIDYSFALRARKIAIAMVFGEFEKSYEILPSYLHVLQSRNPGTMYDICTSGDDLFKHVFLALGPCISVFESCMRPVIVVDGTHLKGKNKGILFVAVTKDGNEQIFPFAVGIGPIEDDESWIWFMQRLHVVFGHREGLIIVSDQHKSIKNAVEIAFPNATHAICYYHLSNNMAKYGKQVGAVLRDAAYCYRHDAFQKHMSVLEVLSKDGAHRRLEAIGVQRWSRSQCPGTRSSFMTSNAAESLNSRLLWARRLPICALLETYRAMVERWFNERRAAAQSRDHPLTDMTMKKLSNSVEFGRQLTVRGTTTHLFKVEGQSRSYLVDLQQRTCDCRQFDLDEIPCAHAAAAIRYTSQPISEYVAHYYRQLTLALTYDGTIAGVPHPSQWIVPPEVLAFIVGLRRAYAT